MEIFTQAGGEFLSRWGHYLSGVTWIGLLYYFNFVQVPSFAEFEAGTRNQAIDKLVPRALWWFRYGALLTLLTGISILAFQDALTEPDYFKTPPGMSISAGILLALVMFSNVWFVIWPNQKKVIANARNVIAGGEADPAAAAAARRGAIASRTNTMFSIPMLFFMGFTSHLALREYGFQSDGGKRALFYLAVVLIVALGEAIALGLFGVGPGTQTKHLDTHRNTIIAGFVLTVIFYLVYEMVLPGA